MNMNMNIRWKQLAAGVAIPLAVGALSSLLTRGSMEAFKALRQAPLTPPDWVFPIVWSILYVLMGTASYLVYVSDVPLAQMRKAFIAYAATLVLNFGWPLLFFRMGLHLVAFVWLLVLIAVIGVVYTLFGRIRPLAGRLILPYLLWTLFAAYLNFGVYWLNR